MKAPEIVQANRPNSRKLDEECKKDDDITANNYTWKKDGDRPPSFLSRTKLNKNWKSSQMEQASYSGNGSTSEAGKEAVSYQNQLKHVI